MLVRGEGEGDVFAFGLVNLPEGAKIKAGRDLAFMATAIAQLELWDVKEGAGRRGRDAAQQVDQRNHHQGRSDGVRAFHILEGEDHWVTVEADGPRSGQGSRCRDKCQGQGWMFKIPTYKAENFKKRLSD